MTLETATLMLRWTAEMTSLTPRSPRRVSFRSKLVQYVWASEEPMSMPSTSRRLSALTPTAILPHFHIGGVDPDIGLFALDGPLQEGGHPLVYLLAEPGHLALGRARHGHGLDEVIDGAGRVPLDLGLLNDRRQRLLDHAAGLQKARKIKAFSKLVDTKRDRPGPRLLIAVAIALREAVAGALAGSCASQRAHLQLHQALGGEANHVAQNISVGGLFDECAQVHHGVGHRRILGCVYVHNPA